MDPVEEEHQAKRAKERAQQYALLQNVPLASVWNRERDGRERRFHMTLVHIPQNLDDAILNLHRCQLLNKYYQKSNNRGQLRIIEQKSLE